MTHTIPQVIHPLLTKGEWFGLCDSAGKQNLPYPSSHGDGAGVIGFIHPNVDEILGEVDVLFVECE